MNLVEKILNVHVRCLFFLVLLNEIIEECFIIVSRITPGGILSFLFPILVFVLALRLDILHRLFLFLFQLLLLVIKCVICLFYFIAFYSLMLIIRVHLFNAWVMFTSNLFCIGICILDLGHFIHLFARILAFHFHFRYVLLLSTVHGSSFGGSHSDL